MTIPLSVTQRVANLAVLALVTASGSALAGQAPAPRSPDSVNESIRGLQRHYYEHLCKGKRPGDFVEGRSVRGTCENDGGRLVLVPNEEEAAPGTDATAPPLVRGQPPAIPATAPKTNRGVPYDYATH